MSAAARACCCSPAAGPRSPSGPTPAGDFAVILAEAHAQPLRALMLRLRRMRAARLSAQPCSSPFSTSSISCSRILGLDHHRPGDPAAGCSRSTCSTPARRALRDLRQRARPDHRAALPADPQDDARFRRDRLLAAGAADPDPDPADAARRGRAQPHLSDRMTARRIDGKAAAAALARARRARGRRLSSARPAARPALPPCWSAKIRRARSMSAPRARRRPKPGWRASRTACPTTSREAELLDAGRRAQRAIRAVDGILVQLPLPHADRRTSGALPRSTRPRTSTAFTPLNAGRLAIGARRAGPVHAARLPACCSRPSSATSTGQEAVVIGRSNIVGKPMAHAAARRKRDRHHRPFADPRPAPTSSAAPTSSSPRSAGRRWSAATGSSPGATVIDVGINRIAAADGKSRLVGDVAFDEASRSRGRDHAGPGRSWADDHRHATQEHVGRRAPPRRPRRSGRVLKC